MKNGLRFNLEIEEIKDQEKFDSNNKLIDELTQLVKIYNSHIEIGFSEDNCLICLGEIIRETKTECKAIYNDFKKNYKQIIKKYYGKVNIVERMVLKFTKI